VVSHRLAGAPLNFAELRSELAVPGEFSSAAMAEAGEGAASPILPDEDATAIPFVTVDPAGSEDLDQAVHIAASDDGGYVVRYAIADVAAFVRPGSALDDEAQRRAETYYFPDERVPLHPLILSEGAASLLPGQNRPAVLWRFDLDARGEVRTVEVQRALVRSREQLDYGGLQQSLIAGTAPDAVALLARVGELRMALARKRHAIDLDLPEQIVTRDAAHSWALSFRRPLPVEAYNAEISLLAGTCAAQLMIEIGFGLLRTVPPPDRRAVAALRRVAPALDVTWPDGAAPGDVLARLDRGSPRHVAFVEHAAALLRGSAYTPFDGVPPEQSLHAGVGATYAHVTAPLRRLVDRYGSEICLAAQANQPVPDWVRERVPQLPETMQRADRLAHDVDRAVLDLTEAWLLEDRVGETFSAVVLEAEEQRGTIAVEEPAVRARCDGAGLSVGERITARLTQADVPTRTVRFARA
jgi:VacB/RNase II family 3'-5' exoribonuclease